MESSSILQVDYTLLSYADVVRMIREWKENGRQHYVVLAPPYSLLMYQRDPLLRRAVNSAALVLPDGIESYWPPSCSAILITAESLDRH